jgi:hypothetical protein
MMLFLVLLIPVSPGALVLAWVLYELWQRGKLRYAFYALITVVAFAAFAIYRLSR